MTTTGVNTNIEAWKGESAGASSPSREESPPYPNNAFEFVNKFYVRKLIAQL